MLACITFTFTGLSLMLSLQLRSVLDHSPLVTGLFLMPVGLSTLGGSAISARVVQRVGMRVGAATGMLVLFVGCLALVVFGSDGTYVGILAATMCAGLAFGIATRRAPRPSLVRCRGEVGAASGLNTISCAGGAVLGVAVLGSLLSSTYRSSVQTSGREQGLGHRLLERSSDSVTSVLDLAGRLGGRRGTCVGRGGDACVRGRHPVRCDRRRRHRRGVHGPRRRGTCPSVHARNR